jgi:hypothetical protein
MEDFNGKARRDFGSALVGAEAVFGAQGDRRGSDAGVDGAPVDGGRGAFGGMGA